MLYVEASKSYVHRMIKKIKLRHIHLSQFVMMMMMMMIIKGYDDDSRILVYVTK